MAQQRSGEARIARRSPLPYRFTNPTPNLPGVPAGYMDLTVPFSIPGPLSISLQGIILNPTLPDGVRLSSAVNLTVQ